MRPSLTLALALLAAGPPARAQEVEERARQQALARYRDGRDLMQVEKWEAAEDQFRAALRLDPLLVLAHYDLGQALMAQREYPDAVRAFRGAREAHRKVTALRVTDLTTAERRREDEVRELKEGVVKLQQLEQGGRVDPALAAREISQLESRAAALEAERQMPPGEVQPPPEFALALGSAYFRSGALLDAEHAYLDALRGRARFGEAHNNLAVVYMLTGRLEQARREVELAEKDGYRVNPQLKQDLDRKVKER